MYTKGLDTSKINRRKKSIQACESIVRANARGTSAGTKDKGKKRCPGRNPVDVRGGEREKEKERRLRSSLKCVGECELVSRESPLSVAPGVPPSVILSARPYFVAHAHAPSLAYTRARARLIAHQRSANHARRGARPRK